MRSRVGNAKRVGVGNGVGSGVVVDIPPADDEASDVDIRFDPLWFVSLSIIICHVRVQIAQVHPSTGNSFSKFMDRKFFTQT